MALVETSEPGSTALAAGTPATRSPIGLAGGAIATALLVAAPWWIPLIADDFWVNILAEILIWSIFAASANLLFGYAGLLSFGQALYFGFGAYGVALGITALGLGFWGSLGLGIAMGTAIAAVAGTLAVRLTWHYFAIITIVFSLIFFLLAVGAKDITGGDDGLSFTPPPIATIGGFELSLLDQTTQYYFILAAFALCFGVLWLVIKSPLGMAMKAVRENADRAGLIGISAYRIRYVTFVIAGSLAGVSGSLFAYYSRYASAQYMHWTVSGEAVIWTIVGGAGTLFGPVLGTGLLVLLREELSVYWEHYLLVLGAIIILVVTFGPDGLAGLLRDGIARLRRSAPTAPRQR